MTSFRLAHTLACCAALSAIGALVSTWAAPFAVTVTWTLATCAFGYMAALDSRETRRYRAHIRQLRRDQFHRQATAHENQLGVK